MAGIAIKIENLDRASYFLDGADGTIIGAEGHFYFVTRWTKDLADSLCDIVYELVLFNDADSLMLKAKMEEAQKVRDYITANYCAEEFKSMQEFMASPEFRNRLLGKA